jgi:hypothetical protein
MFWFSAGSRLNIFVEIFYEKMRIKIACMNPSKILQERLFEMGKKLYLVNIFWWSAEYSGGDKTMVVDDDDQDGGKDGVNNDEEENQYDILENMNIDKKAHNDSNTKLTM